MLWPKASPLDLDFRLCAWAKLFKSVWKRKQERTEGVFNAQCSPDFKEIKEELLAKVVTN